MTFKPSKALIYSLIGSLIWAFALVNARLVLNLGENPLNYTFWVALISSPLWLYLFKKHHEEYRQLSQKNKIMLVIVGVAGSIGVSYLQALALKNTTAVNFAFLYRTIVVFTIFFAFFFFKEKITLKKLVLVMLILVGSYFLTTKGQVLVLTKGDIYTLLMAASAAFVSNILVKHTISKMHPDLSGAVTMIVAVIALFILNFISGSLRFPSLYGLVFIGAMLYFFQIKYRNRSYQHGTASFVTMIYSLTPLFVSIISLFVLKESLDPVQLVGGGIIVLSSVFAEKFKM